MESRLPPIGFEGILSDPPKLHIGFEQYEDEQTKNPKSVYPRDDTMPISNPSSHFNLNTMPYLSNQTTSSHRSERKSLSYPQLFAIYNEIVHEWSKIQWLQFSDTRTKTYLTLGSNTNDVATVQMAIDQYHQSNNSTFLLSQPECLLIRTKSKCQAIFLPNSVICIENLFDANHTQGLFQYKLMAIVCHSNETDSKQMFYKDFHSNSWYIYYDQSILSHSHFHILSNDEQSKLELFIQDKDQLNPVDLSKFTSLFLALCNKPIVYVYIQEKDNENKSVH